MIDINGIMEPGSYEEANQRAASIETPIEEARQAVREAQYALLRVCIEKYPVGSLVEVNVAARRNLAHKVIAINEHGWMTLRNIQTGTERGMMADSTYIHPCRHWYEKEEAHK